MLISSSSFRNTIYERVFTCKACHSFSSKAVRMCIGEKCGMFNQLICFNCVIDGGHAQHAVKYDAKIEKIRKELGKEITSICSKVDENK
ncbi:hypothetical protein PMAYCL1PPCAC_09604, partial [Pristionchus mayeri]